MMQYTSPFALCSFIFLGLSAQVYSDSSTYYWKHFSTSGTIYPWYSNDNSWGVSATEGTGFAVMVTGEDWGTWSPVHTLPKQLKDVSQSHNTWISQTASPEPGYGYDACYDIFIDPVYAPTDRNSINEVMIWFGYQAPNAPLSDNYDANGHPVPVQTNVNLGGRAWDVYLYTWSTGGHTMSYLDRANSGWFSGSLWPFFNHGISNGWYTADQYLNSVMGGWEFGKGNYTALSWGAVGF